MKTFSFIGSDKNAGKTTAFNFVHNFLRGDCQSSLRLCLTSIGLNGEKRDALGGLAKPGIVLQQGDLFVTAVQRLQPVMGRYRTLHCFGAPQFKKSYLLGECLTDFPLILEGPNEKEELKKIKQFLQEKICPDFLLIDGSIDRQFLGHPEVSDAFFFSIALSGRADKLKRAQELIACLSLKACPSRQQAFLQEEVQTRTKSLVFNEQYQVLYRGEEIPFTDHLLRKTCQDSMEKPCFLYLNGALTANLASWLAPMRKMIVILDNFTLLRVSGEKNPQKSFLPTIQLRHFVPVERIFLREPSFDSLLKIPDHFSVTNLYRDDLNEVRASTKHYP